MDYLMTDDIAAFRRAIAFGIRINKPADVTTQHLIDMANAKCRGSALDVLREARNRLSKVHADEQALALLSALVLDWKPGCSLHQDYDLQDIEALRLTVRKHARALRLEEERKEDDRDNLEAYLLQCVRRAKKLYPDTTHEDYDEDAYMPDWLGQAFLLADQKGRGPHRGKALDLEYDADTLDGMDKIRAAHEESSDTHESRLEDDLERYIAGKLPRCIERLISVNDSQDPRTVRERLARHLLDDIRRTRKTIDGPKKRNRMAAANMFETCRNLDPSQLLARDDYEPKRPSKDNESKNATGRDRKFRDTQKHLHSKIKRTATTRSEDIRAIEDEIVLLRYESVKQARAIACSPDPSGNDRPQLVKLRKRTEREAQKKTSEAVNRVWSSIEQEYMENALARARAHEAEQ